MLKKIWTTSCSSTSTFLLFTVSFSTSFVLIIKSYDRERKIKNKLLHQYYDLDLSITSSPILFNHLASIIYFPHSRNFLHRQFSRLTHSIFTLSIFLSLFVYPTLKKLPFFFLKEPFSPFFSSPYRKYFAHPLFKITH